MNEEKYLDSLNTEGAKNVTLAGVTDCKLRFKEKSFGGWSSSSHSVNHYPIILLGRKLQTSLPRHKPTHHRRADC